MMRGNGIQALPWCVRGFMICLRVKPRFHRIMQKAFASVVSFHFRFVYKVTLLRRLVELPVCIPGAFAPAIAPRLVFVLMRFPASQMRFLSENDVRMPRERKWLINDSCAFSDENMKLRRLCLLQG